MYSSFCKLTFCLISTQKNLRMLSNHLKILIKYAPAITTTIFIFGPVYRNSVWHMICMRQNRTEFLPKNLKSRPKRSNLQFLNVYVGFVVKK
jgi:hypothetical protein